MSANNTTPEVELRPFFEEYARVSLATDPKELGRMYAPSFIVGPRWRGSTAR